jgi:putative PIN family toxin of toxin-antitoxin system
MTFLEIFFDSSVLVAAFTFPGVCSKVLLRAADLHKVHVSEYVIEEVTRVLRTKFPLPEDEIDDHIRWLRKRCNVISFAPPLDIIMRDPTDIPILSAAIASKSDILVSGDKDLLELVNPPIQIMSPRALHDLIMQP